MMPRTRFIGGPFDGLEEDGDYDNANWVMLTHNGRECAYKKFMVTTVVTSGGLSHAAAYRYEGTK